MLSRTIPKMLLFFNSTAFPPSFSTKNLVLVPLRPVQSSMDYLTSSPSFDVGAQGRVREAPPWANLAGINSSTYGVKGGLPSQPRPWRPTDGGVRCGGSHPHQSQNYIRRGTPHSRPIATLRRQEGWRGFI